MGRSPQFFIRKIVFRFASLLDVGLPFVCCSNGGSALDTQQLASVLGARFKKSRVALRSIALTTDTLVLTCVTNYFSYADFVPDRLRC